jgi:MOSC domain-containing protein YiiM
MNLDGDKQSDLTVHGGVDKAVYSYPMENYDYWKKHYPKINMPFGMFGENLTTDGLMENSVNIGDQFQIGSVKLISTQPRMPCYKLGIKFGPMDVIKSFLESLRPGIYFKVLQEGEVGQGDKIELINMDDNKVKVNDIIRLYINEDSKDLETMEKVIRIRDLPKGWRIHFIQKIDKLRNNNK